ncbi:YihY/virulence factor BrkB family protein [Fredinandcohnia sp. QZ13]|uniref:YihY/virulence factor BrkB family protein n=1 Tax=Fredinandcohnia sp. QZ13 TaxID=3073144 RepID=UPI002852FE00|nr:YihY/virulence factor BrkB family protein [Fredinandcohnia sp. QZ13]MDR4887924.1 YihY/virulence factor BrkB family protein [Fredinandcohnia sp. QZ13]
MTQIRTLDLRFIKELILRYKEDEVGSLSAELAYFFLLSLFPFLIFLVTLVGYLPISQIDVLEFVAQYAPEGTVALIEENLNFIVGSQKGGLLSIGIIGTLWSSSNGINAVVRAFNKAYDVKETRNFFFTRGISILLTFGMIFVIIVALLLPVFGKQIGVFIFSSFGLSDEFLDIWNGIRWIVSAAILFIVFTFLYWVAPNRPLKIKEIISGAFFATFGWMFVSLAFSYYVNSFGHYSTTYGSLGAIIVLMIWFYLSAMIIIIGGEINAILNCHRIRDGR